MARESLKHYMLTAGILTSILVAGGVIRYNNTLELLTSSGFDAATSSEPIDLSQLKQSLLDKINEKELPSVAEGIVISFFDQLTEKGLPESGDPLNLELVETLLSLDPEENPESINTLTDRYYQEKKIYDREKYAESTITTIFESPGQIAMRTDQHNRRLDIGETIENMRTNPEAVEIVDNVIQTLEVKFIEKYSDVAYGSEEIRVIWENFLLYEAHIKGIDSLEVMLGEEFDTNTRLLHDIVLLIEQESPILESQLNYYQISRIRALKFLYFTNQDERFEAYSDASEAFIEVTELPTPTRREPLATTNNVKDDGDFHPIPYSSSAKEYLAYQIWQLYENDTSINLINFYLASSVEIRKYHYISAVFDESFTNTKDNIISHFFTSVMTEEYRQSFEDQLMAIDQYISDLGVEVTEEARLSFLSNITISNMSRDSRDINVTNIAELRGRIGKEAFDYLLINNNDEITNIISDRSDEYEPFLRYVDKNPGEYEILVFNFGLSYLIDEYGEDVFTPEQPTSKYQIWAREFIYSLSREEFELNQLIALGDQMAPIIKFYYENGYSYWDISSIVYSLRTRYRTQLGEGEEVNDIDFVNFMTNEQKSLETVFGDSNPDNNFFIMSLLLAKLDSSSEKPIDELVSHLESLSERIQEYPNLIHFLNQAVSDEDKFWGANYAYPESLQAFFIEDRDDRAAEIVLDFLDAEVDNLTMTKVTSVSDFIQGALIDRESRESILEIIPQAIILESGYYFVDTTGQEPTATFKIPQSSEADPSTRILLPSFLQGPSDANIFFGKSDFNDNSIFLSLELRGKTLESILNGIEDKDFQVVFNDGSTFLMSGEELFGGCAKEMTIEDCILVLANPEQERYITNIVTLLPYAYSYGNEGDLIVEESSTTSFMSQYDRYVKYTISNRSTNQVFFDGYVYLKAGEILSRAQALEIIEYYKVDNLHEVDGFLIDFYITDADVPAIVNGNGMTGDTTNFMNIYGQPNPTDPHSNYLGTLYVLD